MIKELIKLLPGLMTGQINEDKLQQIAGTLLSGAEPKAVAWVQELQSQNLKDGESHVAIHAVLRPDESGGQQIVTFLAAMRFNGDKLEVSRLLGKGVSLKDLPALVGGGSLSQLQTIEVEAAPAPDGESDPESLAEVLAEKTSDSLKEESPEADPELESETDPKSTEEKDPS